MIKFPILDKGGIRITILQRRSIRANTYIIVIATRAEMEGCSGETADTWNVCVSEPYSFLNLINNKQFLGMTLL